jgi:hypothetical protein
MEEQRFTPDIIARAEELISRIQGISSSRITTDETGRITEIHVVASAGKPPKLIARDVETCLKAELGIHVDYKKIGVVLYDHEDEADSNAAEQPEGGVPEQEVRTFPIEEYPARFSFQSVNLFLSQEGVKAEVELVLEGKEAFGSASSDNASAFAGELIAEATLRAVSEFLDADIKLCLFGVREVAMGNDRMIVVRVDLIKHRDRKSLAGCSIVSDDANRAVVYATLDAVNRILGKIKAKGSVEYKVE